MSIINVTDETFEQEVLKSSLPVLVDFWAEWCAPCRALSPVLSELNEELAGKLRIVKINVDDNQKIPVSYGIRGIPTLLLFKDGQLEATKVGGLTKSQLKSFVENYL